MADTSLRRAPGSRIDTWPKDDTHLRGLIINNADSESFVFAEGAWRKLRIGDPASYGSFEYEQPTVGPWWSLVKGDAPYKPTIISSRAMAATHELKEVA